MATQDQEDTTFVTHKGAYYYKVMPFGLKNAGATYQRLVDKLFKHQLGRNMEVYCIFRVNSGRFLGFIIHQRGIDANSKKVRAIAEMHSPRSVKEVQRLAGRMATLSRFTSECEEAFQKLKACLTRLPQLASPELGETLSLYLAASPQAVGSVLVREVPPTQQPIYYVNHILLRPYFQAHTIKVITDQPLQQILSNFDAADLDVGQDNNQNTWTLHVDGSSTTGAAGIGLILKDPLGETYERSLQLQFRATNNEAEYEALLHNLRLALEMHVNDLEIFSDSQLRLAHRFNRFSIDRIPRAQNVRVDALARSTTQLDGGNPPLQDDPDDPAVARRLRRTHAWYCVVGGRLYRRAFSQPLLRCLTPS
uniref:RNase H type-1 domain-containing protein n=1 Tax=Musa acuminata subsp. malaccensis TaxID=214687 RepID=A0A804ICR2_MUSAM